MAPTVVGSVAVVRGGRVNVAPAVVGGVAVVVGGVAAVRGGCGYGTVIGGGFLRIFCEV